MSRTRHASQSAALSSQVESPSQQSTDSSTVRISGTLRLRAENQPAVGETAQNNAAARRIRWSEDVIDNEGIGKKSSKVCCIYHKSRPVGESSSESESSDSSSCDSDSDSEIDRRSNRIHRQRAHDCGEHSPHDQSEPSQERGRSTSCSNHQDRKKKRRKPSPNAYEKMPKSAKER